VKIVETEFALVDKAGSGGAQAKIVAFLGDGRAIDVDFESVEVTIG
jgi:hypothetical protein